MQKMFFEIRHLSFSAEKLNFKPVSKFNYRSSILNKIFSQYSFCAISIFRVLCHKLFSYTHYNP